MAKSIDLIFFNVFVLLNALFCVVPGVILAGWPRTGFSPASSQRIALAEVRVALDLHRRQLLSEPHAAP